MTSRAGYRPPTSRTVPSCWMEGAAAVAMAHTWAGSTPTGNRSDAGIGGSGGGRQNRRAWQHQVVGVGVKQFTGSRRDLGLVRLPVRGFAALVERAARAHEDGQLVVEVVAVPGPDA